MSFKQEHFELEALEQRLLLSADGISVAPVSGQVAGDSVIVETTPEEADEKEGNDASNLFADVGEIELAIETADRPEEQPAHGIERDEFDHDLIDDDSIATDPISSLTDASDGSDNVLSPAEEQVGILHSANGPPDPSFYTFRAEPGQHDLGCSFKKMQKH